MPAPPPVPDGRYRVRRVSGLVPPLLEKRIRDGRGWTRLGRLPVLPFLLHPSPGGGAGLRYRGPLRFLADELAPDGAGGFDGQARVLGIRYGRFRLEPIRLDGDG